MFAADSQIAQSIEIGVAKEGENGPPVLVPGKFWLHDRRDGTVYQDIPAVDAGPTKWQHDLYDQPKNATGIEDCASLFHC